MTVRYTTIAELVSVDYNGDDPYASMSEPEWRSEVEDVLRRWCRNDASAKALIERIGIRDAVEAYVAAWDEEHRSEYGIGDDS